MSDSRRWIVGVDEPLPAGEEILWSGSPDAGAVARHVLHLRVWAGYMTVLAVVVGVSAASSLPVADVARVMVLPLLLAVVLLATVAWFARLVARTSEYVVTTRRVVLRIGVAFPMVINIPLRLVQEAGLRTFADGTGEVRLVLSPEVKLAYIALWPHVDTLRGLSQPRPKLRGLTVPDAVGAAIRHAVAGDGGSVQVGEGEGSADRSRPERLAPRLATSNEAMAR